MELVSLAKDLLQDAAENVASYRLGQTTLRYLDRALWTVEKCARWAVPPALEQDDRPQPELVRPLPWVFFLALLLALRAARESISLLNLVVGKPPLRSADVVTYIQGKRRYLRTLKYQGNRMLRARTDSAPRQSWLSSVQSLLEFTMCFRRHPAYGNNNTTHMSNNDEVLVVKRNKHGALDASDTTMERLIEKIMVDLDADSDEDSSYTLTNVTSIKSDQSGYNTDSDQDTAIHLDSSTPNSSVLDTRENITDTQLTSDQGSTIEINITMSQEKNRTLDANNVMRSENVGKEHSEENGNTSGVTNKISNGQFLQQTTPTSKEKVISGNGEFIDTSRGALIHLAETNLQIRDSDSPGKEKVISGNGEFTDTSRGALIHLAETNLYKEKQ